MNIDWQKFSEELRKWFIALKGTSLKAPIFLIGTGITSIGEDNFIIYSIVSFISKNFGYPLPEFSDDLWIIILKNLIAVGLVLFGCYIIKHRAFPDTRKKCILVLHEILRSFDEKELAVVLQEFKTKTVRLDFTKYFKKGELTEISKVFDLHKKKFKKIPKGTIVYYGQAHIPLIVYTGYKLGSKSPNILEKDHKSGDYYKSWEGSDKLDNILVNISEDIISTTEEIAISFSFSLEVRNEQIIERLGDSIPIAKIGLENPTLRSTRGKAEIENCLNEYRNLIETIKKSSPKLKKIHLFIASPPSIPFKIGAMLSDTHDPELIVYNWTNKSGYKWAISIQSGEVIQ
jgi:hypothetical protein